MLGVRFDRRKRHWYAVESETKNTLYDITAVARRLGVEVRHVRRLVAERRIPFIKWGHLLRFDPDEIERWVDAARSPERPALRVTPSAYHRRIAQ